MMQVNKKDSKKAKEKGQWTKSPHVNCITIPTNPVQVTLNFPTIKVARI